MYMGSLYGGKFEVAGEWGKFLGLFLLSLGALLPGIFFVINAYKGLVLKVKYTFLGLLAYIVILAIIIPKIFGLIPAVSMGLLGVSEQ